MKGKIKKIFDQQDFPSGFYKRDFVITTEDQYPQDVKFTAVKERTEQVARLGEGDEVLVKFDIRGREYNGNFYVDLNACALSQEADNLQRLLRKPCRLLLCQKFHLCLLLQQTMKTTCRSERQCTGDWHDWKE